VEQFCEGSGLLIREPRFDVGDHIFGRELAAARHLPQTGESLFLGLLGRTADGQNHKNEDERDREMESVLQHKNLERAAANGHLIYFK
jgi:hypothetical protein